MSLEFDIFKTIAQYLFWFNPVLFQLTEMEMLKFTFCLDDAEVSALGLKIGRSPVQISPKPNFSIMTQLPVKSTEK